MIVNKSSLIYKAANISLIITLIIVLSLFFITHSFAQSSGDCPPGFGLDPDPGGGCVPLPDQEAPGITEGEPGTEPGTEIPGIFNEVEKLGKGMSGKLGEIEEAILGDKSTLGPEPDILPLAGIIGAIGVSVIAVYKIKHRNRKSKSDPSTVNVDVITRGGIEE